MPLPSQPKTGSTDQPFGKLFSGTSLRIVIRLIGLAVIVYSGYQTFLTQRVNDRIDTWNGVMYCYNTTRDTIDDDINNYLDEVNFVHPEQTTFRGFMSTSSWQICEKNLQEALKKGNQHPQLNGTLKDYQDTGTMLENGFASINAYYKNQDYLKDNFAKGKTTDSDLESLVKKYDTATEKFATAIDQVADIERQQDIERLRNDPKRKNEVYVLQTLDTAKKSIRTLRGKTISLDSIRASIVPLENNLNLFKNKILSLLKLGDDQNKYQAWQSWANKTDQYILTLKKLSDLGTTTDKDTQSKIIYQARTAYNSMIDQYNNYSNQPENYPLSNSN